MNVIKCYMRGWPVVRGSYGFLKTASLPCKVGEVSQCTWPKSLD